MGLFARLTSRRQPRWTESWAVYPGEVDGQLAMYFVDLGAAAAAPIPELPVRLDIEVRYAAREDGMPADGHLPGVQRLEDVVSAEARREGGVFVGRVLSAGTCRYTAYLPATPTRPIGLPRDDFAPVVFIADDPSWRYVRDALAPDPWQQHVIGDLMVVKALIGQGDGLEARRPVEHVAHFAAPGSAEAAAAELRIDGFAVTVGTSARGVAVLEAVRRDRVCPPELHEVTWAVREVVDRYGGEYDGWGCPTTP